MDSVQSAIGDLERPPSKSNIDVWAIIEICVFVFLGIGAIKDIFDVFGKNTGISVIDIIKVCIYGLLAAGFCFAAYGFFQNTPQHLKTGLLCFAAGLLGKAFFIFIHILNGFGLGSLIELCIVLFFCYILYKQSTHC